MEIKLFKDLTKVLDQVLQEWHPGDKTAQTLAATLRDHATKSQLTALGNKYAGCYKWRDGKLTVLRTPTAQDTSTPIVLPSEEIQYVTRTVGTYGTEPQAKQAASEFRHPDVFKNQSAIFPDPVRYGATVRVMTAVPVQVKQPQSPMNPWSVEVSLSIAGTGQRHLNWTKAFEQKLRRQ